MIVEWTGLCRIHGGRAATASAELTCPVNRATNRSFAPCVPYQEFLAYGNEVTRVKFRLASPRAARRFRGAHARRMRMAHVAAVDQQATPDLNWRKGSEQVVAISEGDRSDRR